MAHYITETVILAVQAALTPLPFWTEIQTALQVLSISPVSGYPPFVEAEVRLVAGYRMQLARGQDAVWQSVVAGTLEAWIYAIHEAAELHAFAEASVDPFVKEEWRRYLAEAHLRAINVELRFVKAWAEQIGMATSEIGLEMENPLRNWSDNHPALIKRLLQHQGWDPPTEDELQTARQFWRRILTGDGE